MIKGSFVRDRKAGLLVRRGRRPDAGSVASGALTVGGFLVSAMLVGAMLVCGAQPVLAETGESRVTSPLGTVILTLQSPQRFTEAKCLFIPLDVAWQRRADVTVVGELTVRKPGTSIANADSFLLAPSEPIAGHYTDYVYVCPADGPGSYVVSGTLSFIGADSSDVVAMPPIAFTVVPARTSVTGLRLSQSGSKVTVSGRAVISSNASAAGGILLVSVREPGATEWANVAVPDVSSTGAFAATLGPRLAPGTLVRAQVLKCKWCTGAKAYARVR